MFLNIPSSVAFLVGTREVDIEVSILEFVTCSLNRRSPHCAKITSKLHLKSTSPCGHARIDTHALPLGRRREIMASVSAHRVPKQCELLAWKTQQLQPGDGRGRSALP